MRLFQMWIFSTSCTSVFGLEPTTSIHILHDHFTGAGEIVQVPQYQKKEPCFYGHISYTVKISQDDTNPTKENETACTYHLAYHGYLKLKNVVLVQ